ncbi:MAG: chlorite dismutase family protein [Deltaproteobacteria bacterium]|nr:chlorite dismutase family protein [Deltaproteobacteria bacterium]
MTKPETSPGLPEIDVNEYGGRTKDGQRQAMNRRLFMQLLVFRSPDGERTAEIADGTAALLRERKIPGVVYADTMDPRGVGLLTWSDDPSHFVRNVRPLFGTPTLGGVVLREDFTMFGRSYSIGYEPDLEFVLLGRPVKNALDEALRWHVWYPLRRTGSFAKLDEKEQSAILREHAVIGHAYGQAGLGHDIRLACHGLDARDNEFVIGLVGKDLHPLSHLVQTMRSTRQTSEFISQMGPFFVGYVLHRVA